MMLSAALAACGVVTMSSIMARNPAFVTFSHLALDGSKWKDILLGRGGRGSPHSGSDSSSSPPPLTADAASIVKRNLHVVTAIALSTSFTQTFILRRWNVAKFASSKIVTRRCDNATCSVDKALSSGLNPGVAAAARAVTRARRRIGSRIASCSSRCVVWMRARATSATLC